MTGTEAEDPFGPEVVAAVTRHMNADHAGDSLLIVRALGAVPNATEAEMIGMEPTGIRFRARVRGTSSIVEVPWSAPIATRAEIRGDVVRMYHDACEVLGVAVRPSESH